MNPRYFIGITLPENFSRKVEQLQRDLFLPGKVMHPLKPHITLLHPDLLQALPPQHFIPKIQKTADSFLPFEIELIKTDLFDNRVLYIDVSSEDLMDFQKKLVNLLPENIKAQYLIGRPYRPHITLVQAKPKQNLSSKLIEDFRYKTKPLLPARFSASYITQFTWIRPRTYKIKKI